MTEIEKFLDYFEVVNASGEAEVKELKDGLIIVTIRDNYSKKCLSKMFDSEEANRVRCGGDVLADLFYKDMIKEFNQYG